MNTKYQFSDEQSKEIRTARKANRGKRIDRRLRVLELRCKASSSKNIASATGFAVSHVSNLIRLYAEKEFEAITEIDATLLNRFQKEAEQGKAVDIREIASAYEKAVGYPVSSG